MVVAGIAAARVVVAQPVDLASGQGARHRDADVAADLARDGAVVARDDLDRDAEAREFGDRRAGIGLGAIDEREKALETESTLVCRRRRDESGCGARCNRDDAGAVVEEPSKHRLRLCRHVDAPREHCLGRTLRDERDARRRADDDGGELTLVVEWQ